MLQRIIIWLGVQEQAAVFSRGLANNPHGKVQIVCAPDLLGAFGTADFFHQWPMPMPHTADSWKALLTEAAEEAARATAQNETLRRIQIVIIISPDHAKDAPECLMAVKEAISQVTIADFCTHIVLELDAVSPLADEEKELLKRLKEDAQLSQKYDSELEKEKKTAFQAIEEKFQQESEEIYQQGLLGRDTEKLAREAGERKASEKRETEEKLKKQYGEKQRKLYRWDLLSVLSDRTSQGAASPEIRRTRTDILCGLALMDDPEICDTSELKPFRCAAYSVQRTDFTCSDLEMAPWYLLYQKIQSHEEKVEDARAALLPDPAKIQEELRRTIDRKCGSLWCALLADDDNYSDRTEKTLVDTFLKYNGGTDFVKATMDECVEGWLDKSKKWLAQYIMIDEAVVKYVMGREEKPNLQSDIQEKLQMLQKEPDYVSSGYDFGQNVSLVRRKKAAKAIAAAVQKKMVKNAAIACLTEIKNRTEMLSAYLETMSRENDAYFGKFPETVIKAFERAQNDWPMAKDISEAIRQFNLSDLKVTDQAIQNYGAWLRDSVEGHTVHEALVRIRQEIRKSYPELAAPYVEQAAVYQMADQGFHALVQMLDSRGDQLKCSFLGSQAHLYLLYIYKWDIDVIAPDGLFTRVESSRKQESVGNAGRPPREAVWTDDTEHMNIQLTLDQDGQYKLTWRWNPGDTSMAVRIDDQDLGTVEWWNDNDKQGSITISVNTLPNDAAVSVELRANNRRYGRIQQRTKNLNVRLTETEDGRKHFLDRMIGMARRTYHFSTASEGVAINRAYYVLSLSDGSAQYYYPLSKSGDELTLIQEGDRDWCSARVILKGVS